MKRIRDTEAGGPLAARARSLLDSVGPLSEVENDRRMQRVRAEVLRASQRRVGGFAARAMAALRTAPAPVLALVALSFLGTAFAAVRYVVSASSKAGGGRPTAVEPESGRSGTKGSRRPVVPSSELTHPAQVDQGSVGTVGRARQVTPPLQSVRAGAGEATGHVPVAPTRRGQSGRAREPGSTDSTDGVRSQRGTRLRKAHGATRGNKLVGLRQTMGPRRPTAASEKESSADIASVELDSGSRLVHQALRALRQAGAPARAARLLARYRRRHPQGELLEEVLSLQVEAARALGSSRVDALVGEYVRRYPAGRYLHRVQDANGGSVP